MSPSLVTLLDLISRFIVAGLLILAGLAKIRRPYLTAETIQDFGISSKKASFIMGICLSIIEIVLGIGLLIPSIVLFASIISGLLFMVFTCSLIYSLMKGKSIACGCFGSSRREQINWLVVSRSISLFIASATMYLFHLNYDNLVLSANAVSLLLTTISILSAVGALTLAFGLASIENDSREKMKIDISRRDFLKLITSLTLAVAVSPVKPALALCCKCQLYRHYDPFCCTGNFFHIRHYFKRCCNSCTGQVGGWHHYQPNGCQCECAEPVGTCGDLIYACTGSGCYINECGCAA